MYVVKTSSFEIYCGFTFPRQASTIKASVSLGFIVNFNKLCFSDQIMRFFLNRLSRCRRFYAQRIDFHFCSCMRYSSTQNESNSSQKPPMTNSKPEEFSKSGAYPTRYGLHQVEMEEHENQVSPRAQFIARLSAFGILVFVIYAFFFSDYNLEYEELMMDTVPGHLEHMKKVDSNYEKRIANLRAKRLEAQPDYEHRMDIRRAELSKATKQIDPGYEKRVAKLHAERMKRISSESD